ncbi:MAG: 16S rRNA (guanine(966)-N(2))-methyltransferase RsmD [Caldisericia bacterium]|nr:16S rRNA (guanine(966)-N(2))-methyltransferase RsmD [Caldisericia bacterium]MDD4613995.1 16S rRNA (guanine(966)-N(2))-methyltransferase RsmD [Caldisericia bacterium]
MKIISGNRRGKTLVSPAHLPLRPTSNKVREALFNILRQEIPDCFFLDLFAGTGAIGINAISEGAKKAYFVEKNPTCLRTIQKNLLQANISENYFLLFRETAEYFLTHRKIDPFHFIFLDPPYNYSTDQYLFLLQKIATKMNPCCTIVLEHTQKSEIQTISNALGLDCEERNYGRTKLAILRRMQQ